MLSTSYNYVSQFSLVTDLTEFFKEKLEEIPKLKSFINQIKLMFSLSTDRIKVEVAEGERIYRINIQTPDVKRSTFGWFVYMPLKKRVDMYMAEEPSIPFIQWKDKKISFNNAPYIIQKSGALNTFSKLVNVL